MNPLNVFKWLQWAAGLLKVILSYITENPHPDHNNTPKK